MDKTLMLTGNANCNGNARLEGDAFLKAQTAQTAQKSALYFSTHMRFNSRPECTRSVYG